MYKALIISVLCAACALGQTAAPTPKLATIQMDDVAQFGPINGPIGITTALAGPMTNVPGAPYSAEATTERVQVLADGNRIVQTTLGIVARDGQGRVRREESLPGFKTNDREAPHIVMIDDPVAQVHWTLDARTKTAIKAPLPNIKSGAFRSVADAGNLAVRNFFFASTGDVGAGPEISVSSAGMLKNGAPAVDDKATKTDLGKQSIEGVPAQGTRITRTIPAGQFGNEQPMVITTETWYSPDLKVLLMSKSSDPRMGDTTYTLTNIQRAEPAASLFQVPDDYTVKDALTRLQKIQ
jgi:hypothetical protein